MRAVTLTHFGGPEVLTLSETPIPTPNTEQLLIHVKATALNRADLLQRRGKYPAPPGESTILGLEIAGEVVAIGNQVSEYKNGDRIFGLVASGAYAEYCVIDQHVAMPIPANLSFTEAAAVAEAFLTANEAIFTLGNLSAGERILIHAGGSGVGTAGIQLAQQAGAEVFVTVGAPDKKDKLSEFHLNGIIDYKNENFLEKIQELTNHKGVDVIIDFIGADYLSRNLESLSTNGRLICVGLMGGSKTEIDLRRVQTEMLQIKGLRMRTRTLAEKRIIATRFKERWLPLFQTKKLKPIIDSVFAFADVQAAHQHMESNKNFGKIILKIS